MAKKCKSRAYVDELLSRRYEPHVEPINRYIDQLIEESGEWMPYVAPTYGGVNARLLAIFQDPGTKTLADGGSGMLCLENNDLSAPRHQSHLENAGIDASEMQSWNAYPWFINRAPTAVELERAEPVLAHLIGLLPSLKVVMVHGGSAQDAWERFTWRHRDTVRGLEVIKTYHVSPQALQSRTPEERAGRVQKLIDDFDYAAQALRGV